MARKEPGTARYRALRDVVVPGADPGDQGRIATAGEILDLDPDTAALLVRDGMVAPEQEA